MALGSAGVLRAPNGIPMLPARLVAQMARSPRQAAIEPIEVILIARDYETAASLHLPWARVVGIAAERVSEGALRRGVPTVVGVEHLTESVDDEMLVLVDGDRGVVLVDPDSAAIAAYQAERDRLAPRHRLYLDYAHQIAHTQDGREIHVLARVETEEDVRRAIENGADALYVPADSPLLPAHADDEEQYETLMRLGEMAVGKPITLAGDMMRLSADALLRAASHIELTLAARLADGMESFEEMRHYLQERRDALLMEEIAFADFRLAGAARIEEPFADDLEDYLIGRVVVDIGSNDSLEAARARNWLQDLVGDATGLLLPVEVVLSSVDGPALETALGLGAVGVIVASEDVQAVKERVRALDTQAWRIARVNREE